MMNLESPCWRFYSDGLGFTKSDAQKQNWIFFGNGTMNDFLLYHGYNPLVGASGGTSRPLTDQSNMQSPSTVLEWSRDTLYSINTSVNTPVNIHAYYVRPRRNVSFTELQKASGGSMDIASAPALIYDTLFTLAKQNQQEGYKAAPSTGTTMQKWDWKTLGEVPFNNHWFCTNFKIIRSRKFTVQPGSRFSFDVTQRRKTINFSKLGWYYYNEAAGSTYQDIAMTPRDTRFWMIGYHSPHQLYCTKDTHDQVIGFDAPPAYLTTFHTRQFCIRIDSSQPQPLLGRLTADQTLGTSQPYRIGGRGYYAGEALPTWITATPAVPQPPLYAPLNTAGTATATNISNLPWF